MVCGTSRALPATHAAYDSSGNELIVVASPRSRRLSASAVFR